jgi:hypothetical protein
VKKLKTWAGRGDFSYEGSVAVGTKILYGKGWTISISAEDYRKLLAQYHGRTVNMGTSWTDPRTGSVGEWLQANVSKTATASYVGAILVHEGFAVREGGPEIRFL